MLLIEVDEIGLILASKANLPLAKPLQDVSQAAHNSTGNARMERSVVIVLAEPST
jgi:hypothetical protein